jgi:hypothetical protein
MAHRFWTTDDVLFHHVFPLLNDKCLINLSQVNSHIRESLQCSRCYRSPCRNIQYLLIMRSSHSFTNYSTVYAQVVARWKSDHPFTIICNKLQPNEDKIFLSWLIQVQKMELMIIDAHLQPLIDELIIEGSLIKNDNGTGKIIQNNGSSIHN